MPKLQLETTIIRSSRLASRTTNQSFSTTTCQSWLPSLPPEKYTQCPSYHCYTYWLGWEFKYVSASWIRENVLPALPQTKFSWDLIFRAWYWCGFSARLLFRLWRPSVFALASLSFQNFLGNLHCFLLLWCMWKFCTWEASDLNSYIVIGEGGRTNKMMIIQEGPGSEGPEVHICFIGFCLRAIDRHRIL